MTIEVRQLLIKSQVQTAPPPPAATERDAEERARVKDEILAECKAWLAQRLQDQRER
jgi:hypothetical protein